MDLADFLLARIAEDEAMARAANTPEARRPYGDRSLKPVPERQWGALVENYLGGEMGQHCARWNPARILAECEAKRQIVELTQGWRIGPSTGIDLLRALALPYADHPDYPGVSTTS